MEQLDGIGWEIRKGIGIITIDNPPENYLRSPDFIPLAVLKKWTSAEELRGIIITGAGKQFSAGGNLEFLFSMIRECENISKRMAKGKKVLDYIENLDIPVVSAIRGVCFGGGLEIALATHVRICSDNALFAFPESNHGLIPGLGGIARSNELTGFRKSLEMVLGGDMISAAEALEMKLVDYIVPKNELHKFAFNYLYNIVKDRPLPVIRSVMKVLRCAGGMNPGDAMNLETKLFCELAMEEANRRKREG